MDKFFKYITIKSHFGCKISQWSDRCGRLGENPLLLDQRGTNKIKSTPMYSTSVSYTHLDVYKRQEQSYRYLVTGVTYVLIGSVALKI